MPTAVRRPASVASSLRGLTPHESTRRSPRSCLPSAVTSMSNRRRPSASVRYATASARLCAMTVMPVRRRAARSTCPPPRSRLRGIGCGPWCTTQTWAPACAAASASSRPEHARAEHDDAAPLAHGLEHAVGVGEVAQRGDALGQLVVVRHEVPRVLLERGEVAPVPFHAVERRHVRPRARREHEPVVAELLARAQPHDARGAVDRGRGDAEEHAGARLLRGGAVADDHGVEFGVADRVLRHQHAVVRLDVLAGDDGELDGAASHGGQQLLDEAGADGSVADEDDPECGHARTPASTRRVTRTTLVLNSGIDEIGSTASEVSRFAACSSP